MNSKYFHLINTEKKIKWVIEEYGIEDMQLVLSNLIKECDEISNKLEEGMAAIKLAQKVIAEYTDDVPIKKKDPSNGYFDDISSYIKYHSCAAWDFIVEDEEKTFYIKTTRKKDEKK